MLRNKNFDLVPGIRSLFSFDLRDDTFLPIIPSDYTFKFEVFNKYGDLVLSKANPIIDSGEPVITSVFDSSGVLVRTETFTPQNPATTATFEITAGDGISLEQGQFQYRLVLTHSSGTQTQAWKGYLTCDTPQFDANSVPGGNGTVLPDGTIYATAPLTIQIGTWYAIATYFRLNVNGICSLTIDGRDLTGAVHGNLSVFQSTALEDLLWTPDLTGMTAFRINAAAGSATIRYLP